MLGFIRQSFAFDREFNGTVILLLVGSVSLEVEGIFSSKLFSGQFYVPWGYLGLVYQF